MKRKDTGRLIEPRSVFKATAVNHMAYGVADYARSRDFYIELFGTACVFDDGRQCAVSFGNPKRTIYIAQSEEPGRKPFIDHFGISIAGFDTHAVEAELKGLDLHPEQHGDYAWTIRDPDGYRIQVCAETGVFPGEAAEGSAPIEKPAAGQGVFRATAVNHIAYRVADYARSRDFYLDLFGMNLMFEDGKKCSVAFGTPEDALYINPSALPGKRPYVDHFALSIAGFDLRAAEGELRRLGLEPEPDGDYAWTIRDPDGYTVQGCAEKGVYPGAAYDPYHNPE